MEIDKKKVVGYVKTYVTTAKDKVVATWKSGTKGKFACIVGAAIILLGLKSCLTGGDDDAVSGNVLGAEYRFSEEDFRTESNTEKMFYVKDGDDDGLKEVVPNLRNIPELLKNPKSLPEGFRPGSENNIGNVYYTDPDALINAGVCTVVHVGDGWVVARTAWTEMFGDYSGFIYTQDEDVYIEKQRLKAGFYVLIGTQKVPLVNGSSKTMFSFVKIDRQSNQLALGALDYNLKAKEATEKENARREKYRKELKEQSDRQQFSAELAKVFADFSFRDMKSQFHLPEEIADVINDIEVINPGVYVLGTHDIARDGQKYAEADFLNAIKKHNWECITNSCLLYNYDPRFGSAAKGAKEVFDGTHAFAREFRISRNSSVNTNILRKYEFCIVDRYGKGERNAYDNDYYVRDYKIYRAFPQGLYKAFQEGETARLPIDADVYCIRKVDEEFFKDLVYNHDVDGFVVACKERDAYNKMRDKFDPLYHQELKRLFTAYAEAHFHAAVNENGNSINVKDVVVVPVMETWGADFAFAISNPDWNRAADVLGVKISDGTEPIQCAKETFKRVFVKGGALFELTGLEGGGRRRDCKFRFFRVKNAEEVDSPPWKCGERYGRYNTDFAFWVPDGADLFCVPKEDEEMFRKISNAKTFEEAWKQRYGKALNKQ